MDISDLSIVGKISDRKSCTETNDIWIRHRESRSRGVCTRQLDLSSGRLLRLRSFIRISISNIHLRMYMYMILASKNLIVIEEFLKVFFH